MNPAKLLAVQHDRKNGLSDAEAARRNGVSVKEVEGLPRPRRGVRGPLRLTAEQRERFEQANQEA